MDLNEAENAQAEYDAKYERAKRLGKFWGQYTKPVDPMRSSKASELLLEIFEWNRDTKKKKKKEHPNKTSKVEAVMTIFHPISEADAKDMEVNEEILEALTWWGTEGYECDLEKVSSSHKKSLRKLKDAVKFAETHDAEAFKSTEDEGLEWKRNPEAAKELTAEIEYNITDILDWFKGGQISAKKKKHINALASILETWWDTLTDKEKAKEIDPSGQDYDCFIGPEADQLVEMYNSINPLQVFWNDKGYDYCKRSGYYPPEECEAFNTKVLESWDWLQIKLKQKKGDGDESSDDE